MVVALSSLASCFFVENARPIIPRLRFFLSGDQIAHANALFRPASVQSGSASWDDYGRIFPDKLRVKSFPGSFPCYAWTAAQSIHFDFVRSRVYACLGVTCHLNFWKDEQGLLRATAVTRGWNGHRIRVSTQSKVWRRKFSRSSRGDSNPQPFVHESKLSLYFKFVLAPCGVWRM